MTKDVKLTQRGADILIAALRVDLCLARVLRYRLQILKDRGLGLRWFGLDAESGLSEESGGEARPVLMRLSRFFMMKARWRGASGAEIAQAAFHVRPGSRADRGAGALGTR